MGHTAVEGNKEELGSAGSRRNRARLAAGALWSSLKIPSRRSKVSRPVAACGQEVGGEAGLSKPYQRTPASLTLRLYCLG